MKKIILLTLILFSTSFFGQPGTIDLSFNPGTGANDNINSISLQNDGKIIIVGDFTSYNGTNINRIARLNTDGSLDTSFNITTGANNVIYHTSNQNDGKIIIVGDFTSYNGTNRNRIARLNIDGSLDTSFNPGTGANNYIYTTSIQNDGKIIVGGNLTSYNGTVRNGIARLNTNGTLDTSFNPGTGASNSVLTTTMVITTSIQNDGKIVIGGSFTNYNGTARNRIARLNTNGSLDTSFNPGTGANERVSITSFQNDGKIIIGGSFTSYNGTTRNRIARLNTDGSIDTSFNIGQQGADQYVRTISIQNNGKIIIGGGFINYNGTARYRIARLNIDGSIDFSFNQGTGADNWVYTTCIQNDGKIIIGGTINSYNGIVRNRIVRINGDSTLSNPSFDLSTTVIYPNPSNGYFNVKIDDSLKTKMIEVYSVLGQKIYYKSIVENESSIDLSNQPKGIYFYKISDNYNVIKSGKLILE